MITDKCSIKTTQKIRITTDKYSTKAQDVRITTDKYPIKTAYAVRMTRDKHTTQTEDVRMTTEKHHSLCISKIQIHNYGFLTP